MASAFLYYVCICGKQDGLKVLVVTKLVLIEINNDSHQGKEGYEKEIDLIVKMTFKNRKMKITIGRYNYLFIKHFTYKTNIGGLNVEWHSLPPDRRVVQIVVTVGR